MQKLKFLIFLLPLVLSSCVTMGRFEDMERAHSTVLHDNDSLRAVLVTRDSTISERDKSIAILNRQVDSLRGEWTALNSTYMESRSKNSEEMTRLIDSLENLQKDIYTREQRLRDVEQNLSTRDSMLSRLKNSLNDALLGFNGTGLTINIRNGKVYVSLSNQLLFSSGKTDIDKHGKEALLELAQVLNNQPDLNILVEGHTDNVPVSDLGSIKDNWDLSVLRATEVVRYLTKEGEVDPKRIIASGRSEYFPVDEGSTPEARAKNRRTEIILTPKLTELFELIGNPGK
jgi:chemotaxis protein MotB